MPALQGDTLNGDLGEALEGVIAADPLSMRAHPSMLADLADIEHVDAEMGDQLAGIADVVERLGGKPGQQLRIDRLPRLPGGPCRRLASPPIPAARFVLRCGRGCGALFPGGCGG